MASSFVLLALLCISATATAQLTDDEIINQHREAENDAFLSKFEKPTIVSNDEGILMRLRKDQDFTVRRPILLETSPLKVQQSLDALESAILTKASDTYTNLVAGAVGTSVKSAVDTTVSYIRPMTKKAEGLAVDAANLAKTITSTKSNVLRTLNNTVSSFKSEITSTLNTFKSSTDKEIGDSLNNVNETLEDVTGKIGKVRLDADNVACNSDSKGMLRLKDGNIEGCDGSNWKGVGGGSKHTYVQWGNNVCAGKDKGVKQLYSGYAWAGHHDHRGANEPVCLKSGGGANGGKVDGDDSANIYHPLRLEGPSPSNGNIQNSRMIRCSMCVIERNCYLEMGLNGCATSDYEPMYSGSSYGGYHSQTSALERICIDRAGRYDNGNSYGAYIYPTKLKNNFDGRQSESFVKCHVCCEK